MAVITAHPTGEGQTSRPNQVRPPAQIPRPIPPSITIRPKQESLDRRIRNLEALGNGVFLGNVLASYLALPGLVGFWPMSSVQRSTGNAYDLSGQARTLTYNGNPAYSFHNGLVPYIGLDGTGDFLSRADETDLDITGAETIFTTGAAGLTLGGWFYADAVATLQGLIGKYADTSGPYGLYLQSDASILFRVRNAADAANFDVGGLNITAATWYFIAARYTPSTEIKNWVGPNTNTNVTSIPASLLVGTDLFYVGSVGGGTLLTGRASLCFLCANALGDDLISSLFQSSRVLFGV